MTTAAHKNKLALEDYPFKQHKVIVGFTGSGKSTLAYTIFENDPNVCIYFNSQLNDIEGHPVTSSAKETLDLILDGHKKIIFNPLVEDPSDIDKLIEANTEYLGQILNMLILFKYNALKDGYLNETPDVSFYLDEAHWYQTAQKPNKHIKWICTSGRRFGLFMTQMVQKYVFVHNSSRDNSLFIIGFHKESDDKYIKDEICSNIPEIAFESYIFYFVNDTTNKIEKMKVLYE